jgi:methionyl-tRNA synthetase
MLREVPFGNDGNFSHENAVNRINSDLANSIGNLSQRSLSMIAKNCEGKVPQPGTLTDEDKALLAHVHGELLPALRGHIDRQQLHLYADAVVAASDRANIYIDREAPWKLKKTDPARMETVLYVLAETVRCLALMLQPVTPGSAAKMLDQLAIPADARSFACADEAHSLKPGTALPAPEGVFPRIAAEGEAMKAAG